MCEPRQQERLRRVIFPALMRRLPAFWAPVRRWPEPRDVRVPAWIYSDPEVFDYPAGSWGPGEVNRLYE